MVRYNLGGFLSFASKDEKIGKGVEGKVRVYNELSSALGKFRKKTIVSGWTGKKFDFCKIQRSPGVIQGRTGGLGLAIQFIKHLHEEEEKKRLKIMK